jgi:quinohemoprotein ethanol dehydrogenase
MRKVLLHPPKNGFFYVIDRQTGKLLSAKPFVDGITWATHVDIETGRPAISPSAIYKDEPVRVGPGAAHNWHPIAFSPKTNLVYLAATESTGYFLPEKNFKYIEGQPNLGVTLSAIFRGGAVHGAVVPATRALNLPPAAPPKAYLLAWNPVTQSAAWRADTAGGGVLATAGNLVFQGRSREGVLGELAAYRADNGQQVWSYPTPNAITPGPITYSVDGEQYVAVSSGAGMMGFAPRPRVRHNGRVVVFKLNGAATLPSEAPFAPPANPPQQVASAEDYKAGAQHYDEYCGRCHGFDAQSPNVVPDLRRSAMLTSKDAWHTVVIDGALSERGMASWAKFLSPDQVETIRAYVGEEARKLRRQEQTMADSAR